MESKASQLGTENIMLIAQNLWKSEEIRDSNCCCEESVNLGFLRWCFQFHFNERIDPSSSHRFLRILRDEIYVLIGGEKRRLSLLFSIIERSWIALGIHSVRPKQIYRSVFLNPRLTFKNSRKSGIKIELFISQSSWCRNFIRLFTTVNFKLVSIDCWQSNID